MIRATPTGVEIDIRVIPRSRKTAIDGIRGDAILVRLAAAPVDGRANEALVDYLAERLGVSQRASESWQAIAAATSASPLKE